ncbi:hypothetical protein AB0J21_19225 [Streptomyces sp. NPDC049954]|uniref:aromatic-ring hydroxylase C-terminal domain-containing protein n=1 Tax=Streptomyces sp. NPDC049954 TaxID=3155779 RepID=UPI00341CB76A
MSPTASSSASAPRPTTPGRAPWKHCAGCCREGCGQGSAAVHVPARVPVLRVEAALLVRPDGRVAWAAGREESVGAAGGLGTALGRWFGESGTPIPDEGLAGSGPESLR